MIGLAEMAMRLACLRIYRDAEMARAIFLHPRGHRGPVSANAEYYRIIDRLTRGERP